MGRIRSAQIPVNARALLAALPGELGLLAEQARIVARFQDGRLAEPLRVLEFRIPAGELTSARHTPKLTGTIRDALERVAKALTCHAGDAELTAEYGPGGLRWVDRAWNIGPDPSELNDGLEPAAAPR